MAHEIIEKLKKELSEFKEGVRIEKSGHVVQVGDGIATVSGLGEAMSQELLSIKTKDGERAALALNLEEETVGILILGDATAVKSGDTVKSSGRLISIPVGDEVLGRVIDPLGEPLDGLGDIFKDKEKISWQPLENRAPSVLERESVNRPLHTGVKAIDAMIPIGRGQRELLIGDRQTGKTAIAIDTIINQYQEKKPPVCIYVAIGQKEAKVARIAEILKQEKAFSRTVVVAAFASSPASLSYLAPFTGCAIGEYFRDRGEDALVIYDDLSKHAWAYRQISLLLRRPPGREAYPGDIFYLHSRLLERAAKLSKEKGGGSLTALPIIETQLGDVSAYVPTNVISITDGQIYLESELFHQGQRPAVNIGLSVSRVGSAAQTKAMKKVAGKLRLQLAQFRELQAFVQFASDVDAETREKIHQGQIMNEVLKQADLEPISFAYQVPLFYAALNGYLNHYPLEKLHEVEQKLSEYLKEFHLKTIIQPLEEKETLDETLETTLKTALENFKEKEKLTA